LTVVWEGIFATPNVEPLRLRAQQGGFPCVASRYSPPVCTPAFKTRFVDNGDGAVTDNVARVPASIRSSVLPLVAHQERVFEPRFIRDSSACRCGKGTLAASDRLMELLRRVTANGHRAAWALKLDVASFFPSIHTETLYRVIAAHIRHPELLWLTCTVLFHDPTASYCFRSREPGVPGPESGRYPVPAAKSLFGKRNERGLPIGNLTSQFWGNVYPGVVTPGLPDVVSELAVIFHQLDGQRRPLDTGGPACAIRSESPRSPPGRGLRDRARQRRDVRVPNLIALLCLVSLAACTGVQPAELARTTPYALARTHGRFVSVDGMRVFAITAGTGRDVVLLHGNMASTYSWRNVIEPLAARYRMHAIDLPGYGFSDKPADASYTPDWQARNVVGYLDAAGIERAVLVGNSMGGHIATEVAIRYPNRVAALILLGASGLPISGEGGYPLSVRMLGWPVIGPVLRAAMTRGRVRQRLREAVYDPDQITDADVDAFIAPLRSAGGAHALVARLR
jgi:hypothetical protein